MLRTIYHRDFICNIQIGLSEDKTPIDSEFIMSKGKVTWVFTWFLLIIMRTVCHKVFIFHMLIGLGENKSPGVFKFTRPKIKVTWVTCDQLCKQL